MKHSARLLIVIALLLGGCDCPGKPPASHSGGNPAQVPAPSPDGSTPRAAADAVRPDDGALEVKNPVLSFQEPGGEAVLIMTGSRATMKDGVYSLDDPNAEIQLAGGEKIALTGAEGAQKAEGAERPIGIFDPGANSAKLAGGVVMSVGDIRIDMDSVTWDNTDQTATSTGKVTIRYGETELTAAEMLYTHGEQKLVLSGVGGMVGLTAEASAESPYTHAVFEKNAKEMIILGSVPQKIAGGVDIALSSPDPEAKPLTLRGEELVFQWDKTDAAKLAGIELNTSVTVEAPQAEIQADEADIELATSQLVFAGHVKGRAEAIDQFDASGIVYDLASSDLRMKDVQAKGIPLGKGSGGYSAMDIDSAPNVEFKGGEVRRMHGGVRVTLRPSGGKGKPLRLQALEVKFEWPPSGGSPSAIRMEANVQIDLPDGQIRSKTAMLDTRKRNLTFTGNVNGTSPQITRFDCDKVVTNLDTGDTHLVNLIAKDVPIGDTAAAPGEQSYKTMDIDRAPDAFMKANRFDVIKGGVELTLEPASPEDGTLKLKTDTMQFTFASEEDSTPSMIAFEGNVDVIRGEEHFSSDRADLDLQHRSLALIDNVSGSAPTFKDFRSQGVTYDLVTGGVAFKGRTTVQEVQQDENAPSPEKAAPPASLAVEDIRDWPGLLGGLQKQSAADKPSPGKRIAGLLKPDARAQLAAMPIDEAPEVPMKDAVVKALNKILERTDLYDKVAWEGIELNDAIRELLARPAEGLSTAETVRLNRMLLEAAYPGTIKAAPQP